MVESVSLFLFGVLFLLVVEVDDRVEVGVIVGLSGPALCVTVVVFVFFVLLAGPGLGLDLFTPDGPATLLASFQVDCGSLFWFSRPLASSFLVVSGSLLSSVSSMVTTLVVTLAVALLPALLICLTYCTS